MLEKQKKYKKSILHVQKGSKSKKTNRISSIVFLVKDASVNKAKKERGDYRVRDGKNMKRKTKKR